MINLIFQIVFSCILVFEISAVHVVSLLHSFKLYFQHVKVIPLLNVHEGDQVVWKHNPNGVYIVRSDYHLIMESLIDNSSLKVVAN